MKKQSSISPIRNVTFPSVVRTLVLPLLITAIVLFINKLIKNELLFYLRVHLYLFNCYLIFKIFILLSLGILYYPNATNMRALLSLPKRCFTPLGTVTIYPSGIITLSTSVSSTKLP